MSMPNIPNITPDVTFDRCEAIDLILASIAMEEMSLSHILNAEGEKLQFFLKTKPCHMHEYLQINKSIHQTMKSITRSQILLEMKLDDVLILNESSHCKCDDCCDDHHKKHDCKEVHQCGCDDCRDNDPCDDY
ncbi:hypothetical protein MUN88_11735 [Gracilibacillus caseinilyticus]|uniref:Uncharacterized protein n=1 Tax=Gracilibacillus caseinilyticus TaxID=2932256 RepID=A0ABY4ERF5_9BACI|nr:hypothetical protein [Gracilibacillus caseinilyticus]UOQ46768.1 hypothetical protein MUN88_11735 [Gracilibacillus caseinilyticus]